MRAPQWIAMIQTLLMLMSYVCAYFKNDYQSRHSWNWADYYGVLAASGWTIATAFGLLWAFV